MNADDVRALPVVAAALRGAFGDAAITRFVPLGGGASRSTFEVGVSGKRYVLRRVVGPGPLNDAARHFACLRLAAARAITPPLVFADDRTGIAIQTLVDAVPLRVFREGGGDATEALGALLRRLHDGPAFPVVASVPEAIAAMLANLAAHHVAPPFATELGAHVAEARDVTTPHIVLAPCHHDLHPSNVIHDGTRPWFVDWEAAWAGDPFHDLVTLAGLFAPPIASQSERLFAAYFARAPSPFERARLVVARALALACTGAGLASFAALRGEPIDWRAEAPAPTAELVMAAPATFGAKLLREALASFGTADHRGALAALR